MPDPALRLAVVQGQAIAEAQDVPLKTSQLGRAQTQAHLSDPQGPVIGVFLTSVPPPNYRALYNGEPRNQTRPVYYSPSMSWHREFPPPGFAPGPLYGVAQEYPRAPQALHYANRHYGEALTYNTHLHRILLRQYEALLESYWHLLHTLHSTTPGYCNCPCRTIPPTPPTRPQFPPIGYRGNWTSPLSSHSYESELQGTEGSVEDYLSPYYGVPLSPRYRQTSQSSHGYNSEPPGMVQWSLGINADEMPSNGINNIERYGTLPTQRTTAAGPCRCAGFCNAPAVSPAFQPLPALQALHSVTAHPAPVAISAIATRQTPAAVRALPAPATLAPLPARQAPAALLASPETIPEHLLPAFSVPPPPLPPTTWQQPVPQARDPSQFLSSRADDLNNIENVPVVSANRELKTKRNVSFNINIKPFTRNKKLACRPARPSAPINFAPPPVSTVETSTNRPRYYSEVARGVPRRTQAQIVSAISNDPWPNRNMRIPGAGAIFKVQKNSDFYASDTTRGIRFGAVGDGRPKAISRSIYYFT